MDAERAESREAFHALRSFIATTSPTQALGLLASVTLVCIAASVLAKTVSSLSGEDLRAAFAATHFSQIIVAFAFAALSYAALAGYDFTALRQIRASAPWRAVALASFASYAISFNLGFPLITGPAVRYWVYARAGVTALQVAHVTLIVGVTFWLGMLAMLGLGLIVGAADLSAIDGLAPFANLLLGVAVLASIAAYCVWTAGAPRRLRLRGRWLALPGAGSALTQMTLGVLDIFGAAAALYALLPAEPGVAFAPFLAIYVFACLLGVVSHAPGGVGVFEATMLHALPGVAPESLLASLLLFRLIYYFVPLALAAALLWRHEGLRHNGDQSAFGES